MKDFYYILGVEADCPLSDIKEAYRKLSKKFHPDLNQGDEYFENRFKEVQEAYDTLSDADKRALYNVKLKQNASGFTKESFSESSYRAPQPPFHSYKHKRRGIGYGMLITLVLIAIVLGTYLVKWLGSSKSPNANRVAVAISTTHLHHKKHKKKSQSKSNIAADSSTRKETAKSSAVIVPKVISPKPISPKPDSNKDTPPKKGFLYAAYVHPNATEVVNMRAAGDYSSAIVATIPGNSKVLVLEKGDAYYKVSFNDRIGYVPKWALK
jgi:curved DNA-binding protein CbpA